ncbi:hypothetical protein [Pseudarthrobacter sp. BIM B-2242]|uniref:hypothetical protein n=1 Tax=Pseudarthrobacter sp. BIM B-2242 TaxID=2772401 RepID=UPI00168B8853|nr:hypothetical protein [Pseudarthrobacter sp. BIM B-2242]QOD02633.1 hypothetical protein IDT60_14915 [Pseudarthrobacter sp. BIM B-2242]
MHEALFLVVAFLGLARWLRHCLSGRASQGVVSAIAVLVYVLFMWVPAHLQESGLITSKLDKAGFAAPPVSAEIQDLALRWSLELGLIVVTDVLVGLLVLQQRAATERAGGDQVVPNWWGVERVAVLLVVVGASATLIFPPPALDERAAGGQGFEVLLRTFLLSGLALISYHKFFGKRSFGFLLAGGVIFLLLGNVRSPLLVVIIAFIAGMISRNEFRTKRRFVSAVALILVFAFAGSVMSNMRANLTRNYGYTAQQVVDQTFENPWTAPYESGLDTLDGYRFSQRILTFEEPRPSDLLAVVTTFIPRAIWPEKPEEISVDVSSRYLRYEASGQYLSPIGYLSLALGSYVGALAGIILFSALMSSLALKFSQSFWLAVVVLVTFRFMLGGSAFDLYYGLTIVLPILLVRIFVVVTFPRHSSRSGCASKVKYIKSARR